MYSSFLKLMKIIFRYPLTKLGKKASPLIPQKSLRKYEGHLFFLFCCKLIYIFVGLVGWVWEVYELRREQCLCNLSWLQTHDPPASTSWVLSLWISTTNPSIGDSLITPYSCCSASTEVCFQDSTDTQFP